MGTPGRRGSFGFRAQLTAKARRKLAGARRVTISFSGSARDAAGNRTTSAELTLTVSNTTSGGASEVEVLRLVMAGLTNDQIADSLFLSPRTVETHLSAAFRKLQVRNRLEVVIAAQRFGEAQMAAKLHS